LLLSVRDFTWGHGDCQAADKEQRFLLDLSLLRHYNPCLCLKI